MSRYEFKLPDLGEGAVDAEIVAWKVAAGQQILLPQHAGAGFNFASWMNQDAHNFPRHGRSQFLWTVFIGSSTTSTKRPRVADFGPDALASHRELHFAANALAFHFKGAAADAK